MSHTTTKPRIHFHIPKTAGTSLRDVLVKHYSPEHVAFLMPTRRLIKTSDLPFDVTHLDMARRAARRVGLLKPFSAAIRRINRDRAGFSLTELEEHDIQLAIGHFMSSDITEPVADIPRTSVVREPLARMRSHFSHWQEAKGSMWWHKGTIPYGEGVAFEDFATDPALANYQAGCLGGLTFEAIGVADNLPAFLESQGIEPDTPVPTLNPGKRYPRATPDPGFMRDFAELHAADYELYETALLHSSQ